MDGSAGILKAATAVAAAGTVIAAVGPELVIANANSVSQKILLAAGPFGVRAGSVRGPFGVRSGPVRANFGPKFSEPKIQNFNNFKLCGRRRRGGPGRGPSSCRPEPRRPEGPRRGGDGRTN